MPNGNGNTHDQICIACRESPGKPRSGGQILCDACHSRLAAGTEDAPDGYRGIAWGDRIAGSYPSQAVARDAWMTVPTDSKLPFAPYASTENRSSWSNPENWTDFETVQEWLDKHPRMNRSAFIIQSPAGDYTDEGDPLLFVDYDDVIPEGEERPNAAAMEIMDRLGETYTDISTSGTGVHQIFCGRLPDGVRTVTFDLGAGIGEVEIYDRKRVCVMTGERIAGTPEDPTPIDGNELDAIIEEFTDEDDSERVAPDDPEEWDPEYSEEEIADIDSTTDLQAIYDAIRRVTPHDIRLRSSLTGERAGGGLDFDPAWADSDSGTRLGYDPDIGWIYRKGDVGLDALQVVALEEGIITSERDYPDGESWVAAVETLRERGAHIPEYEPREGGPANILPAGLIEAADDAAAKALLREHGLDAIGIEKLRERLENRICTAMQEEDEAVIRAPTGSGKTFLGGTTEWREHPEITGDQPVLLLEPTRDARDEAYEDATEAGVEVERLLGRGEACPVARGIYDYDGSADHSFKIEGMAPSEWFEHHCEGKGIPFSVAHSWAHDIAPNGLPCKRHKGGCPSEHQYDDIPRDDNGTPTRDVIVATHNFAFVPGLRHHSNVIMDERPDFTSDMTHDRVRSSVNAYLSWVDGRVENWADLAAGRETLSHRENYREMDERDIARRRGLASAASYREVLQDDVREELDERPDLRWYFETPQAHTLAPAIARAVWTAEERASGRRVGKVRYKPPRFENGQDTGAGYNAVWVTVVLDQQHEVRRIRTVPDFSSARSVIGLDAHAQEYDPLWMLNTHPGMETRRTLSQQEEALYRRFVRGLEVVQVGTAVNPVTSDQWWDKEGTIGTRAEMIARRLREVYGGRFKTAITSNDVEADLERRMNTAGVPNPALMHYGATKGRNDFGGEDVGLCVGTIDPGDGPVLDTIAELDLDAEAPRVDPDEHGDEAYCQHCAGNGCKRCDWTGRRREHGREFVGEDAGAATAALEAVRQGEVAQAVGRWARQADDPQDAATVYVMTSVLPDHMVDLQVPGVVWAATDNQREVLETLAANEGRATIPELTEEVGVTRQSVHRALETAAENGHVEVERGVGRYGANLYTPTEAFDADGAVAVEGDDERLVTERVEGSITCSVTRRHAPWVTPPEAVIPAGAAGSRTLDEFPSTGDDPPSTG